MHIGMDSRRGCALGKPGLGVWAMVSVFTSCGPAQPEPDEVTGSVPSVAVKAGVRSGFAAEDVLFRITLPSSVSLTQFAAGASSAIALRDRAKVQMSSNAWAPVTNTGNGIAELGVDAQSGEVTSLGGIVLRDRARVNGSATSSSTVTLGNGAVVTGQVSARAPIAVGEYSWTVRFPATSKDVTLGRDARLSLAPGAYARATIGSGARLDLRTGTYTFDTLDLEPQAVLGVDTTTGPVSIYVRQTLIYRGTLSFSGPMNRLLLGYAGTQAFAIEASFRGTLVAPHAGVRLGTGGTTHEGAVFAKSLELDPDVRLKHVPFAAWPNDVKPGVATWTHEDRVLPWPAPTLIWKGEPLVAPRGSDYYDNKLFVTDPGDRTNPKRFPARIVKFTVENDVPKDPTVFFMRPGFLISAKWSKPTLIKGKLHLILADQGVETPSGDFTGEGAKVFLLPVKSDGTAGEPRVLWAGPPFVCPTAVARIQDIVYVTDPCAGSIRTRPERPDHPFVGSRLFKMPITGGRPTTLFKDAPFTSMIGICPLVPRQLIVTDTDSGRVYDSDLGGRPNFAPPAAADRWIFDIVDPVAGVLSKPRRETFTEAGPLPLHFSNVTADARITITSQSHQFLDPFAPSARPTNTVTITAGDLPADGILNLTALVEHNVVDIATRVTIASLLDPSQNRDILLDIRRRALDVGLHQDNKHGGARIVEGQLGADIFTTDSAPGHARVWIYPQGGGTPVAIATDAPLVRPVSAQLNTGATQLFIADQSGALFTLPFPSPATFNELFPFREDFTK